MEKNQKPLRVSAHIRRASKSYAQIYETKGNRKPGLHQRKEETMTQ